MYAIETPLGRFEGEDEKSAKAALRKAVRVAEREQEKRENAARQARLQAQSLAYRIIDGKRANLDWYAVGQQYSPVAWGPGCTGERCLMAETLGGRVEIENPGRYLGCWSSGSGYAEVVLLGGREGDECAYAIGVADGQYALAEIPPAFWPTRPVDEVCTETCASLDAS
jgi:hypothetical protein